MNLDVIHECVAGWGGLEGFIQARHHILDTGDQLRLCKVQSESTTLSEKILKGIFAGDQNSRPQNSLKNISTAMQVLFSKLAPCLHRQTVR